MFGFADGPGAETPVWSTWSGSSKAPNTFPARTAHRYPASIWSGDGCIAITRLTGHRPLTPSNTVLVPAEPPRAQSRVSAPDRHLKTVNQTRSHHMAGRDPWT